MLGQFVRARACKSVGLRKSKMSEGCRDERNEVMQDLPKELHQQPTHLAQRRTNTHVELLQAALLALVRDLTRAT